MVAGALGDLPDVGGGPVEDVGDLRVLEVEGVAEDENRALDRVQPLERAEQGEARARSASIAFVSGVSGSVSSGSGSQGPT